jgi:hypothetical protein
MGDGNKLSEIFCTGPSRAARAEQTSLVQERQAHPTKEGPLSDILLESPFAKGGPLSDILIEYPFA